MGPPEAVDREFVFFIGEEEKAGGEERLSTPPQSCLEGSGRQLRLLGSSHLHSAGEEVQGSLKGQGRGGDLCHRDSGTVLALSWCAHSHILAPSWTILAPS